MGPIARIEEALEDDNIPSSSPVDPTSHEWLVEHAKAGFAGLSCVEAKCIEIHKTYQLKVLQNEDWQALLALHQQLMDEHFEILMLLLRHPSTGPTLFKLVVKYSLPQRLWSSEHMSSFIATAYTMLTDLIVSAPELEAFWAESLGNLARYQVAVEQFDQRARDLWNKTAQSWYNKAHDINLYTGELHHHLALLCPPHTMRQLSKYLKALTSPVPFECARSSISVFFDSVLQDPNLKSSSRFVSGFIGVHEFLFSNRRSYPRHWFDARIRDLDTCGFLRQWISEEGSRLQHSGVDVAICNIAACLGYTDLPSFDSSLRSAYRIAYQAVQETSEPPDDSNATTVFCSTPEINYRSVTLASLILAVAMEQPRNIDAYPLVHVYMVFIRSLLLIRLVLYKSNHILACNVVNEVLLLMPWADILCFLNNLVQTKTENFRKDIFPVPKCDKGQLPEDFEIRGQWYAEAYFPTGWFSGATLDEDARAQELPSHFHIRKDRLLGLGYSIASLNMIPIKGATQWIGFDDATRFFTKADVEKREYCQ